MKELIGFILGFAVLPWIGMYITLISIVFFSARPVRRAKMKIGWFGCTICGVIGALIAHAV